MTNHTAARPVTTLEVSTTVRDTPRPRARIVPALLASAAFALVGLLLPLAATDTDTDPRTSIPRIDSSSLRTIHAIDADSHDWQVSEASWYGPGFYGRRTACGQTMTSDLVGVAHRDLPCGTLVRFEWHGTEVVAPVVDRGPYVSGREWDLTHGACARLGRCFTAGIAWTL